MKVSELVAAEVRERFATEEAPRVLSQLQAVELPLLDPASPPDRVFLAVLKLADGRPLEFDKWLREACIDWRDVLVASGLGHADWRRVLGEAGFRVPAPSPAAPRASRTSARRVVHARPFLLAATCAASVVSASAACLALVLVLAGSALEVRLLTRVGLGCGLLCLALAPILVAGYALLRCPACGRRFVEPGPGGGASLAMSRSALSVLRVGSYDCWACNAHVDLGWSREGAT